jgi:hypothetical protein
MLLRSFPTPNCQKGSSDTELDRKTRKVISSERRKVLRRNRGSTIYKSYPDLKEILEAHTNLEFLIKLRDYVQQRTLPDDMAQFRSAARLYEPRTKLLGLAKRLLSERERLESSIEFVAIVLHLRLKLKLNFRKRAASDLEESILAFETQDQRSAIPYAPAHSSLHSYSAGIAPTRETASDSCTTFTTTQCRSTNPDGATAMHVTLTTPRRAYINKYSRKAKPDQDLLNLMDGTLKREENFLEKLDRYLSARRTAQNLPILLPEVIECDERCTVFRPNEGKDFPALVTLASKMLPDDQDYEVALAIAWIFQRRNRLTGNKRAIEPWKTHSRASSWDRRFFRIPDLSQEASLSSTASQTQATTQESTSIYYSPRTMLSESTCETHDYPPTSQA